jgi:1-acyl-sn-glycerol-3-phosphate acyltransferase
MPASGGVIVGANHRSYADPPLVGVSIPKEVHFLAKRELFLFAPFGWLISNLNAHPLNRSGDVSAFKVSQRLLEAGCVMIVFPEGRRNKSEIMAPAKAGVGLLSKITGCPIVPTYIHNSAYLKSFRKIIVTFGKPLYPEGFEDQQSLADEVMRRISELRAAILAG